MPLYFIPDYFIDTAWEYTRVLKRKEFFLSVKGTVVSVPVNLFSR